MAARSSGDEKFVTAKPCHAGCPQNRMTVAEANKAFHSSGRRAGRVEMMNRWKGKIAKPALRDLVTPRRDRAWPVAFGLMPELGAGRRRRLGEELEESGLRVEGTAAFRE